MLELALGRWRKWRDAYNEQRKHTTILVVDDEPSICDLLEFAFEELGYPIESVHSAERAWARIQEKEYSLLVTDKNLPGMSGVDLITQISASGTVLPSVVITGYASVDSIAAALAAGAVDYVAKPFINIDHVVRRLGSIVERGLLLKFLRLVSADLAAAVMRSNVERDPTSTIAQRLASMKSMLAARGDVLVLDCTETVVRRHVDSLAWHGFSVRGTTSPEDALSSLLSSDAPVVAMISLEIPEWRACFHKLRAVDPLLVVLAATSAPDLQPSLDALEHGATDIYLRAIEDSETLRARLDRLVTSSRRERLYFQLIATLYSFARQSSDAELTDFLCQILTPEQLLYIEANSSTVLNEAHLRPVTNRRRHPRVARKLVVSVIPLGADPQDGVLRDISAGGVFVHMKRPPAVSARVQVRLILPTGSLIEFGGTVVRTVTYDPDPNMASGCGILATSPDSHVLADYLATTAFSNLATDTDP